MSKLYKPHDSLFKEMMGRKEVAQEFFQTHLPSTILDQVDLEKLEIQKETFIDKHLTHLHSCSDK